MQCHVTERTDVTVMIVRYNAVQVKMLLALLKVLTYDINSLINIHAESNLHIISC